MELKTIPIETALTDSLSLKIPFDACQIVDKRLTSYTCIYYESLDMVDEVLNPPKPILITYNGITVRFSLVEIPIYDAQADERTLTKFVVLTLSSKLLKERYFEGIHRDNVMYLYNEFMAMNVIRCSFDSFLDGYASDIDVCINLYVEHRNHYLDALNLLVHDSGTKAKYLHLVNERENLGLSFNKRTFAKPSLPFIKCYFKQDELLSKSAEFYNTYLFPHYADQIKNLTRIEATIKNYEHKKRLEKFGIIDSFKTLREYLAIGQSKLKEFVIFSLKSYITPQFRVRSPVLSPTDHLLFEFIQSLIIKGYDETALLNLVETFKGSNEESEKVAKSRMRKKIKDLKDLIIEKDNKIQTKVNYNNHVLTYLRQLNIK